MSRLKGQKIIAGEFTNRSLLANQNNFINSIGTQYTYQMKKIKRKMREEENQ